MPNLRSKTWTTTTPANVEDAQYWEDHLISDENAAKAAGAVQDAFKTIEVQSGGSTTNVVANKEDAITLEAGTNITLTAIGKNIRINSTGGGGGGGSYTASKGVIISDTDIEADLQDYDLSSEEATAFGSEANGTYAVGLDSNGDLAVRIPSITEVDVKLGAHNYLQPKCASISPYNATFVRNDNGTITKSGTVSGGDAQYVFVVPTNDPYAPVANLEAGEEYILSGCPSGGSASTYEIYIQYRNANNTAWSDAYHDYGSGVRFTARNARFGVYVRAFNGNSDTVTFSPMIRLASDTDTTYAPFAMTNRELTVNLLTALFANPVVLTSANNLNDITTPGVYQIAGSVPTNAPTGMTNTYSAMFVLSGGVATAITQIYIGGGWRNESKHIAIRGYGANPASWSAWRYITDATS